MNAITRCGLVKSMVCSEWQEISSKDESLFIGII